MQTLNMGRGMYAGTFAPCYLIELRGPRVEGPPQEELGDHAAQGPHVDGLAERQAKDDLRSSAEERRENTSRSLRWNRRILNCYFLFCFVSRQFRCTFAFISIQFSIQSQCARRTRKDERRTKDLPSCTARARRPAGESVPQRSCCNHPRRAVAQRDTRRVAVPQHVVFNFTLNCSKQGEIKFLKNVVEGGFQVVAVLISD